MQEPPRRETPPHAPRRRKHRRFGRVKRFFRGYLMFVGALTTLYVLLQLFVWAFVEIGKWLPTTPGF